MLSISKIYLQPYKAIPYYKTGCGKSYNMDTLQKIFPLIVYVHSKVATGNIKH